MTLSNRVSGSCGPSSTKPELVDECKKRGISGYSRLKKDELVNLCCAGHEVVPKQEKEGLSPENRETINRSVLRALRNIGSDCDVNKFWNNTIEYHCENDKDDGVIFESRKKYEDDIDDYDDDEDLDDFVEDDDFPNFIGKKIVESAVEKAAKEAGFTGIAAARDHEKGYYSVKLELKIS